MDVTFTSTLNMIEGNIPEGKILFFAQSLHPFNQAHMADSILFLYMSCRMERAPLKQVTLSSSQLFGPALCRGLYIASLIELHKHNLISIIPYRILYGA